MILVPYHEAKTYIKEADVLLFRGEGLISWLIKRYGSGVHSHAAIAHWDGDNLECIEFREFEGGRSVSLQRQVESHPDNIDVFRCVSNIEYNNYSSDQSPSRPTFSRGGFRKTSINHRFSEDVAKEVTDIMNGLTGLPYGWKNFMKLAKHYLPFCRLAEQNIKDEEPTIIIRGNMDDQENIDRINMQFEIDQLKERVLCLEDTNTLRDQQLHVLKKFIDSYLLMNININGGEHGGKIGVLKIPKAKK